VPAAASLLDSEEILAQSPLSKTSASSPVSVNQEYLKQCQQYLLTKPRTNATADSIDSGNFRLESSASSKLTTAGEARLAEPRVRYPVSSSQLKESLRVKNFLHKMT
jgi:hypothetical protein